jgi:hypothetical protein
MSIFTLRSESIKKDIFASRSKLIKEWFEKGKEDVKNNSGWNIDYDSQPEYAQRAYERGRMYQTCENFNVPVEEKDKIW